MSQVNIWFIQRTKKDSNWFNLRLNLMKKIEFNEQLNLVKGYKILMDELLSY